jgi:predicted HAD superfamily phosphohydrolase YqeG
MEDKKIILQTKTRYVNKIKEVDKQILELQEEKREYSGVIKDCDNQLIDLDQPNLF